MQKGTQRLCELFDAEGVEYEMIHHERDVRAEATAEHTHTPPEEFAKSVFLWIDGEPALAVVPANRGVAIARLRDAIDAAEVHIASETDMHTICPDCEIGAAPPFGNLYGLPVYVSSALAEDDSITFNGGDHEHAFRVSWADFERLAAPRVVALARYDPPVPEGRRARPGPLAKAPPSKLA